MSYFFIFAQGFSLKMQLLNEQIKFLIGFVRFFESKTLKTLILDTFASENTIKPLFFASLDFGGLGIYNSRLVENCVSSGLISRWPLDLTIC